MANATNGGFRCVGTLTGAPMPMPLVRPVANNYNTAIGIGDVITTVTDGTVSRAAVADNGKLLGVVTGVSWYSTVAGGRTLKPPIPASTTFTPTTVGSPQESLVEYIPCNSDVVFAVQADDGVTFTTIAGQVGVIQKNVDMTVGNADSVTGYSVYCLDISVNGTATANFRVIGINGYSLEGGLIPSLAFNDPTASRFEFLVVCNESVWPDQTATGV